ncbi:hypothetical protein [Lysinibacillus capsici]|uniref:hypothetical protein n=1 Tax=Lysinibacillus capsici TaxID=2115968 RepID=UPI003D71EDAC
MLKVKMKQTNVYSNFQDLYESYSPALTIFFEGELYEKVGIIRNSNTSIHTYRCEKELHTLKIHIRDGSPYHVEGVYEVLNK